MSVNIDLSWDIVLRTSFTFSFEASIVCQPNINFSDNFLGADIINLHISRLKGFIYQNILPSPGLQALSEVQLQSHWYKDWTSRGRGCIFTSWKWITQQWHRDYSGKTKKELIPFISKATYRLIALKKKTGNISNNKTSVVRTTGV